MSRVRSVIEKIVRLQDEILRRVDRVAYEELIEELSREPDRVGVLEIRSKDGVDRVAIALSGGRARIVDGASYDHKVSMDVDTFLDLVTGDLDLGEAWALGLVDVEGEDDTYHLVRWVKWFRVLREGLRGLTHG